MVPGGGRGEAGRAQNAENSKMIQMLKMLEIAHFHEIIAFCPKSHFSGKFHPKYKLNDNGYVCFLAGAAKTDFYKKQYFHEIPHKT